MFTKEIKDIRENYYDWLRNNHQFIPIEDDSLELYSPFLDYFGDSISVNISKYDDKYLLTDYGETLWNLEIFGVDLTSDKKSKKYKLFNNILNYDRVYFDETNKEIKKLSSKSDLSQSIYNFVESLANISNLAITKRETTISLFKDEVMNYFIKHCEDLYPHVFPDVSVQGKSKLTHKFDLTFPGKH